MDVVNDRTRHRQALVQERARLVNRRQKVLEVANSKLAGVATDITGVSARKMLAALREGITDAEVLANLAQGRLQAKRAELARALQGRMRDHHRFLRTEHLSHLDYLDEAIDRFGLELEQRLGPFEEDITLLDTIPGVNQRVGEIMLAEFGHDLTRFPSADHVASWAGVCPGNNESAGKRLSGRTRKGSRWLRQALIEAAHGAGRIKNTYLGAQFRRLAARWGKKKAVMAVAPSILVIA